MTKQEAIKYFGGVKALADALGVWPQAVYAWPDDLPRSRQFEIQVKSKGALKVDEKYI